MSISNIAYRLLFPLLLTAAFGCSGKLDYSKIKCKLDGTGCPKNYVCTPIAGKDYGKCELGAGKLPDGAVPADASGDSSSTIPGRDATGADGATDANLPGTGGVGGGPVFLDGGTGGIGGMTSNPDSSTGGIDAPVPSGTGGSGPSTGAPDGSPCTTADQCANGRCIDGFCCASACTGCNACANKLTGKENGVCAPVTSGIDPNDACADETATKECGNDGTCDGKGACRKVGANHICAKASCSADGKTFTPATTCDGSGACTTATAQSCNGFQCAETGCMKTCTAQADCGKGNYCDTVKGTCASQKANGQPATNATECTSGQVADGVCCDKACTGCSACTSTLNGQAANTTGQCLPVKAGMDAPHAACTAKPPCGLDGKCDGNGECRYTPTGTACAADVCTVASIAKSVCDGAHACTPSSSACPNSMTCATTSACKASCTVDGDCVAGFYCSGGACKAQSADGVACTTDNQCQNGNCVAGICCHTACGTCNTCATGTCKALANGTACGTGSVCNGGQCGTCAEGDPCIPPSGSNECLVYKVSCTTGIAQCKSTGNQPNTKQCGPAQICSGANQLNQMTCNNGACPAQTTTTCPSTGCSGTTCNAACNTSTQTACGTTCCTNASQYCSESSCLAKAADPAACSANNQCTSNRCSSGYCCATGTGCSGKCCSGATSYCSAGGSCVQCTQDSHCGGTTPRCSSAGVCVQCTADTQCSGGRTCQSGTCACPLGGPLSSCGTCLSWDFSSGLQGWEVINPSTDNYLTNESGNLVLHFTSYDSSSSAGLIQAFLCPDHTFASTNGYTVTANVRIMQIMTPGLSPANVIGLYGNNGKWVEINSVYDPVGYTPTPIKLTGVLTADSSTIMFRFTFQQIFTGTIVLEDVKFTSPF